MKVVHVRAKLEAEAEMTTFLRNETIILRSAQSAHLLLLLDTMEVNEANWIP